MSETATHYLVVDLEATCCDRGAVPRAESEIIEIGAVLVEADTLRAVEEFQTFVRPVRHPRLTTFCTELTTIKQADVDAAPLFTEVAPELRAFGEGAVFCSWGNYDRNKLEEDARFHGVPMPLPGPHINLKDLFARVVGGRRRGNHGALARVGLTPVGTHHRGIDDARNIARLLPFALGRAPIPEAR
jgi:inhibitor of KinA sporulation pathway (predicted exonuclease)